jgi:hypothetical protein
MSLPAWAQLSIIAPAVLFSPALAFLGAIAVEIVIGVLVDADVPYFQLSPPALSGGCCSASCGATEGPLRSRREKVLFDRPNFTIPFNVAGYPAISVCAGLGAGVLPVAIQLVGKPFQEPTLFRIADAFEKATPVPQPAPGAPLRPRRGLKEICTPFSVDA